VLLKTRRSSTSPCSQSTTSSWQGPALFLAMASFEYGSNGWLVQKGVQLAGSLGCPSSQSVIVPSAELHRPNLCTLMFLWRCVAGVTGICNGKQRREMCLLISRQYPGIERELPIYTLHCMLSLT
jgi:hypothetical protein